LIRADSDAFETIVRTRFPQAGKDSPRPINVVVDPNPEGSPVNFAEFAGGSTGVGPRDAVSLKDSVAMTLVVQQRQAILRRLGIQAGGPFKYPECGGTLAPPPPPGGINSRAKCPRESHYYLAVGLPSLGVPENLRKLPHPYTPAPDLSGEVWTAIDFEAEIGAGGQNWFQHALFLRRDPTDRRLKLADKRLLSWAE
jgi:hypothetical protein